MYDFSLVEISEPVKTIVRLLQNEPERFHLAEKSLGYHFELQQIQVRDNKTGKEFLVQNSGLHGGISTVMDQDWMSFNEKIYLAQEVLALVSRNRQKALQKEKDKWLHAYQEDIPGKESVSEPEAKPEPESPLKHELSPLEKVAKEHTAKLLAEEVRKQDLKCILRVILVGVLASLVPLVYLLLSK